MNDDPPDADLHQRPNLQELETNGVALGGGELGALAADAANRVQKYLGDRGEPQPHLIGVKEGR